MRKENDSTIKSTVICLAALLGFIIAFIKKAIRAGRGLELLVSTPLLIWTYYVGSMYVTADTPLWSLPIPLLIYSGYWWYLLSHEKITSVQADKRWADRDWWWTLDGWQFEEEVAKIFRLNGYKAEVTKKTGDGGVDLILYKDGKRIAVQCKHYQGQAPVSCVRELNGVREDLCADELIMIASSGLTQAGYDFLGNKPYYTTLDLEDMIRMGLRPADSHKSPYSL